MGAKPWTGAYCTSDFGSTCCIISFRRCLYCYVFTIEGRSHFEISPTSAEVHNHVILEPHPDVHLASWTSALAYVGHSMMRMDLDSRSSFTTLDPVLLKAPMDPWLLCSCKPWMSIAQTICSLRPQQTSTSEEYHESRQYFQE